MKSENWLLTHIHRFEYFGGVAKALVPNNLKVGINKALRGDPILNKAYRQLVDYCQTTIVSTHVKPPKDMLSVEGSVGYISHQIIAALRYY